MEKHNNAQSIRLLPVFQVCGIDYEVHVDTLELVDRGNALNRIREEDMEVVGGHLEFWFDKQMRKPYHGVVLPEGRATSDFEKVRLHSIEALDPEGMLLLVKQGKYPPQPEWFSDLPKVEIDGTEFYVDQASFYQVDNPWNEIKLLYGLHVEQGKHVLYYDPNIKNVPLLAVPIQEYIQESQMQTIKRFEFPAFTGEIASKTVLKEHAMVIQKEFTRKVGI